MGVLDTYGSVNFGTSFGMQYSTINEVRRAYDEGKLTYNAAYRILMDQFGISDLNIQDILIIEPPQFDNDVPLDPGLADAIDFEVIPDTNLETQEIESESVPMTDNQRYLLIGLVVAFGLFGLVKK